MISGLQSVGFCPISPHPVTDFATVYTAMRNVNDLLRQLNQKHFPLFCDEGVYRIARHIQLIREKEFENIVIMLGSFHTSKVLLACVGKYLTEVEQSIFSSKLEPLESMLWNK